MQLVTTVQCVLKAAEHVVSMVEKFTQQFNSAYSDDTPRTTPTIMAILSSPCPLGEGRYFTVEIQFLNAEPFRAIEFVASLGGVILDTSPGPDKISQVFTGPTIKTFAHDALSYSHAIIATMPPQYSDYMEPGGQPCRYPARLHGSLRQGLNVDENMLRTFGFVSDAQPYAVAMLHESVGLRTVSALNKGEAILPSYYGSIAFARMTDPPPDMPMNTGDILRANTILSIDCIIVYIDAMFMHTDDGIIAVLSDVRDEPLIQVIYNRRIYHIDKSR